MKRTRSISIESREPGESIQLLRVSCGGKPALKEAITRRLLTARRVTPEAFRPYGQAIFACEDGKPFDETDAQLVLGGGIPRFYIMRLLDRGRCFHQITRHLRCTQCLGSSDGRDWTIAVAPPSEIDRPNLENLAAFWIPGNCFIKLEVGTWHAGPYFEGDSMVFYNLELSDTNVVDHFTHDFHRDGLEFEIVVRR